MCGSGHNIVADCLVSSTGFTWFAILAVHRHLPQHWNSTKLWRTWIWSAMTLARKEPRPGAWDGGLRLQASKRWTKMESSGVPVVFETCETLVVLVDWCSGVGALDFSKSLWNGMEGRCKWDGGESSETCNLLAREKSNQVNAHYIYIYTSFFLGANMEQCFFERFILTSWSRLQCVVVDKAILSQIALYVLMFDMVWHCFCPQALAEALKVNQTLTNVNLERNDIGTGGAEAWCLGRGSAAPGLETVNENGVKCCTRGVRDLWDFSGVGGLVFGC